MPASPVVSRTAAGLDEEDFSRRRRAAGCRGFLGARHRLDAFGHARPQGPDVDEQHDSGFDARSGRAGGARVAVHPRLEVALEVVMEERRHQGHEREQAKDDKASKGPAASHGGGHNHQYRHDRPLPSPA